MSSYASRSDATLWPWPQRDERSPHWLLDQLPRAIQAPARSEVREANDRGGWQITITLAPADQAALEAMQPSAYALCAAAQHALGMASLGSQIDRERGSITLRLSGTPSLTFVGAPALWWLANATPPMLHDCVEALLVRIGASAAEAAGPRAGGPALMSELCACPIWW
jgi:hypothetical protein